MEFSPWLLGSDHSGWENNSVEGNVVLTHKLDKFNIFLVLPPLLPIISVASSDRDVANWCIKPHIEHFFGVFFKGHGSSPFKVSSDAAAN